jgi:hypothetical protein
MINFTNILQYLQELFPVRSYASELEEYIESRHPQSAADIDRYSKEYSQKISQGGWQ